jgi:hypothetical protein
MKQFNKTYRNTWNSKFTTFYYQRDCFHIDMVAYFSAGTTLEWFPDKQLMLDSQKLSLLNDFH